MDVALLEWFNGAGTSPLLDALMVGATVWGLGALPGVAAVLWMGRERRVATAIFTALFVGLCLTLLFQFLALRPRPTEVRLLLPTPNFPSFPSGHAVAAFATATVLALAYRRPRVGLAALMGATLIAISRIYLGHHYPSDVVAGALLGGATGAACYGFLVSQEPGRGRWRWLLWPQIALMLLVTQMAYLGIMPWHLLRWPLADKVLHFLLFGSVVFWLALWWGPRKVRWRALTVPLPILVPFAVALVEELLQQLSPRRTASLEDLASDLAGMLFFWWLAQRVLPSKPSPDAPPRGTPLASRINETI